jgi:hypothetical protein
VLWSVREEPRQPHRLPLQRCNLTSRRRQKLSSLPMSRPVRHTFNCSGIPERTVSLFTSRCQRLLPVLPRSSSLGNCLRGSDPVPVRVANADEQTH